MANKVLFAGGGLDSLSTVSGSPTESATAGGFDATYCDSALFLSGTITTKATFIDAAGAADPAVDGERFFLHWEFVSQQSSNGVVQTLYDSSGFPWLRVNMVSSAASVQVEANTNTGASPTWTSLGTAVAANGLTRLAYDLVVDINSAGNHTASLYIGGVLAYGPFTWAKAAFTNVASVNQGSTGGTGSRHSQILATVGYSTIGAKVDYNRATGAGTTNTMSGAYTDINEAVLSDATVLVSGTAGQRATFAWGDTTVPANYVLRSVFQFVRAKNDGAAPANLKGVVRSGGTDYDMAANFPGIGIGFMPLGRKVDLDPATGATWTQAGFNATEWGVLSAT